MKAIDRLVRVLGEAFADRAEERAMVSNFESALKAWVKSSPKEWGARVSVLTPIMKRYAGTEFPFLVIFDGISSEGRPVSFKLTYITAETAGGSGDGGMEVAAQHGVPVWKGRRFDRLFVGDFKTIWPEWLAHWDVRIKADIESGIEGGKFVLESSDDESNLTEAAITGDSLYGPGKAASKFVRKLDVTEAVFQLTKYSLLNPGVITLGGKAAKAVFRVSGYILIGLPGRVTFSADFDDVAVQVDMVLDGEKATAKGATVASGIDYGDAIDAEDLIEKHLTDGDALKFYADFFDDIQAKEVAKARDAEAAKHPAPKFRVGDRVWLLDDKSRARAMKSKGLFRIAKYLGINTDIRGDAHQYEIALPGGVPTAEYTKRYEGELRAATYAEMKAFEKLKKAVKEEFGEASAMDVTVVTPDNELSDSELAARIKSYGIDRRAAWSQFVIARSLSPRMDAKDFMAIFDGVSANPHKKTVRVDFEPTHRSKDNQGLTCMVTQRLPQQVRYVLSHGGTGADPVSMFEKGWIPIGKSESVSESAPSPKAECFEVMGKLWAAVLKKTGAEKVAEKLSGDGAKPFQVNLVFMVSDLAADVRNAPIGRGIRQFGRGPGGRLGIDPPELSLEAAKWWYDQTDAVQYTMTRAILAEFAKSKGITYDKKKMIESEDESERMLIVTDLDSLYAKALAVDRPKNSNVLETVRQFLKRVPGSKQYESSATGGEAPTEAELTSWVGVLKRFFSDNGVDCGCEG